MSLANRNLEFLGNKTPKSFVNEFCAKQRVTPEWKCTDLYKIPDPPKFKCVCTIPSTFRGQEITAEAVGGTKKEAEHTAALEIIHKILTDDELETIRMTNVARRQSTPQQQRSSRCIENMDTEPVSDTDDNDIFGDPIGELNTVCLRRKFGFPQFTEDFKRGPGNTNIFTVTCKVAQTQTLNVGRRHRKQDAKRVAAFRVLKELKAGELTTETNNINNNNLAPRPTVKPQESLGEVSSSVSGTSPNSMDDNNKNDSLLDDNSMKNSLTVILEKLKKSLKKGTGTTKSLGEPMDVDEEPVASSSTTTTAIPTKDEVDSAEIDDPIKLEKIKRKLAEHHNSLSAVKRKYDPFSAIKCYNPSEQCLKFAKDYEHVFQHLPYIDSLEESLISQQFQGILDKHGGALNLFKKTANNLKITFQFGPPLKLKDGPKCVFLSMNFPLGLKEMTQKKHVTNGVGSDMDQAKQNAALNALRFIRLMLFDNSSSAFD